MLGFIFSWTVLWWVILLVYVPACLGLIVVVLLQKGKGVGFAGAFGVGGGTEAVFGPRSSRSLPQKLTYTMAGAFMFLALVMSVLSGKVGKGAAPELAGETPAVEEVNMNELFGETPAGGATPEAPAAAGAAPVTVEEETSSTPVTVEETAAPETAPAETTAPAATEPAPAPVESSEQTPPAAQ
ncbi:MAG: preprotein translocase subunit SecG [Candidatus Hydrogenedentes bacterium]|nr:preprotein translocase subunit SecG [Candidatus Hydrogenedentota bacterium]